MLWKLDFIKFLHADKYSFAIPKPFDYFIYLFFFGGAGNRTQGLVHWAISALSQPFENGKNYSSSADCSKAGKGLGLASEHSLSSPRQEQRPFCLLGLVNVLLQCLLLSHLTHAPASVCVRRCVCEHVCKWRPEDSSDHCSLGTVHLVFEIRSLSALKLTRRGNLAS